MIHWVWRYIVKWVWNYTHAQEKATNILASYDNQIKSTRGRRSSPIIEDVDGDQGLNITVRNAIGGYIVTFRRYDLIKDRSDHRLYIIPEDHDFQLELGKLITMETLKG